MSMVLSQAMLKSQKFGNSGPYNTMEICQTEEQGEARRRKEKKGKWPEQFS